MEDLYISIDTQQKQLLEYFYKILFDDVKYFVPPNIKKNLIQLYLLHEFL